MINPGIDPHYLFKDPMQIKKIIYDKKKIPFITGKMLPTLLDLQVIANSSIYSNKLDIPMLFLVSMKDRLCQPNFVMNLYGKLKNPRKEIVFFDQAKHEVLQDEEYPEARGKILEWSESCVESAVRFKMPKYIKFNYSVVDWRKASKTVAVLVLVLYLVFKRKRLVRIFQLMFASKFAKIK